MINFKRAHFEKNFLLTRVHWYVARPLSYQHLEKMMGERGVHVNHSTVQRWVVNYTPPLEKAFYEKKRSVESGWRLDETHIKV